MNDLTLTLQEPPPFAMTLSSPTVLAVAVVPPPSLAVVVAQVRPVAVVVQASALPAVSTVGLQGPPGRDGAGVTLTHHQANPAAVWPIVHGLGRFPSVTVVDSAGSTVLGDVTYTDANNLTLHFAAPFSGTAYLN